MSQNSNIEWTDASWNPVRGCSMAPGSELGGCLNCYAARNQLRRPGDVSANGKPFAILTDNGPRWSGRVELVEKKLLEPLRWRKPRRVFVNSMSDLFHENLPDESIDQVLAVMLLCPHLTLQVLTKRARRLREYFMKDPAGLRDRLFHVLHDSRLFPGDPRRAVLGLPKGFPSRAGVAEGLVKGFRSPLPAHIWVGVSVENQPTADERIPELLKVPAAVRFVSYEPALGPVDFNKPGPWDTWLQPCSYYCDHDHMGGGHRPARGLDWGIIGGESGPGARPFNLEWARDTIQQFAAAGVPLFVKQLGARPFEVVGHGFHYAGPRRKAPVNYPKFKDSKGGNMDEWPADLRVREFPKGTYEPQNS